MNTVPNIIKTTKSGDRIINAIRLNEKSIILLKHFAYILFLHNFD